MYDVQCAMNKVFDLYIMLFEQVYCCRFLQQINILFLLCKNVPQLHIAHCKLHISQSRYFYCAAAA